MSELTEINFKYAVVASVPKLEDISHVKVAGADCKILRCPGEAQNREWFVVPSYFDTPDEFISEGRLMLMFGQHFFFYPYDEFMAWVENPKENKCPEPLSVGTAGFKQSEKKEEIDEDRS